MTMTNGVDARLLRDLILAGADVPEGSRCPVRTVLDHVTGKWSILVLVALTDHTLRWSVLRRAVPGVSEKMLAQTLRTLEADGLVLREALPVIPPHVEYSLTPRGQELVAVLQPLLAWSARNAEEILGGAGQQE